MDIAPDCELLEKIKMRLMKTEGIVITKHIFKKFRERPITEEQVKCMLLNAENMVHVEFQKDVRGEKYKLVFRKSGKYDIIIVVRYLNSHLKVITAYQQNKKRIRIIQKLRRRRIRG